jgi:hypothetical protein
MEKLFQCDILSVAFVVSIIVFGSSLVFLLVLDLSSSGRLIFILFTVASFFSSLSLILQIKERRKKEVNQK